MTTIVYYDNEIMADTKALIYHQNGLDTKSTFRKGIKILKNDHLIVISFGFMFPESKTDEILETAEWVAKALVKAEKYGVELGVELISLNFTSMMVEKLIQFVDPHFRIGRTIESKICILTKDRTICIANSEFVFINKVSGSKIIFGYNHVISHDYRAKEGTSKRIENQVVMSIVDNDKIDYYVVGTGEKFVESAIKLGLTPKEGFKLAIKMDMVSSVRLSNGHHSCYSTKALKPLKPFTIKEIKELVKGE
jgi:hypothetical protein